MAALRVNIFSCYLKESFVFLVCFFPLAASISCKNPPPAKIADLLEETTIESLNGRNIYSASVRYIGKGKFFVVWSRGLEVSMAVVDVRSIVKGKVAMNHVVKKVYVAGGCGGRDGESCSSVYVFCFPFTDEFTGNREVKILEVSTSTLDVLREGNFEKVGPFSSGGEGVVEEDRIVVAYHSGFVGDFGVFVEAIDREKFVRLWKRRISSIEVNSFGISMIPFEKGIALAWSEREIELTPDRKKDEIFGRVMFAIIDRDGDFIDAPSMIAKTNAYIWSPDLGRVNGKNEFIVIYKNHPLDEYRMGVYAVKVDKNGRIVGGKVRIGRGDGPSSPILLNTSSGFAIFTLRGLAGDMLVGVNLVDFNLEKLQREIQIYAHNASYSNLTSDYGDGRIVVVYSSCSSVVCSLFSDVIVFYE